MKKTDYLKVGVSILLLGLLGYKADLSELADAFLSVPAWALLAAFGLNVVMVLLNTYRWKVLLMVQGVDLTFSRLFGHYLTGIFFNNFLPGSVGGDVYRVLGISSEFPEKERALSSVFMERALGLLALLPISLVAFVAAYSFVSDLRLVVLSELALVGAYVMFLPMFELRLLKVFSFVYNPFFKLFGRLGLKERAKRVYSGIEEFLGDRRAVAEAAVLSILSRVVWIAGAYCLSKGMGHDIPVAAYYLLLPIIEFIRMFPVSINGLGVREGAFVLYFGAFGMSVSEALALSILIYAMLLVIGVVGGINFGARSWKPGRA